MELAERLVGDIAVISISETLTADDVPDLHRAMDAFLERGLKRAVFDLAELKYIDSLGLGELVACQLRAIKAGATLRLANAGSAPHHPARHRLRRLPFAACRARELRRRHDDRVLNTRPVQSAFSTGLARSIPSWTSTLVTS
jgi:anti-anti-sigma factor